MANSATVIDTIRAEVAGNGPIYEYEIVLDTVDTDLTVKTPAAGKRIFVVGIWLSETSATNLTFVSGSNTKVSTFELAANQGLPGFTQKGFFFVTNTSEALKVRSSVAITSTVGKNLILRLVEGTEFFLN